jgi:ferredoxin-type protein NapF
MIRLNRRLVQILCLTAAAALLWPLPFWLGAPRFAVQASPFVAISYCLAARGFGVGTGIGLAFAAATVLRRRFFCKYICPTGLLLDGMSHIGLKKTSWWTRCLPLGQYAALLTAAGAIAGYPLLLWMDPLAILSNSFAVRAAGNVISGILAGLGFGILVLLSLTSGGIWCARLCPLGGIQDLLAWLGSLFKLQPKGESIAALRNKSDRARAFGNRRFFLSVAAGIVLAIFAKRLGGARGEYAPLRPPGSVAEKNFAGICLRCGNCVRACPEKIIHPDTGQAGTAGLLAPVIQYEKKYCREDCNACTQVCPSGAIQVLDLKQKRAYVIGEALVDLNLCLLALGRRDCDACMVSCPFKAVQVFWDDDQYVAYPIVDREKCNGCGACEIACPTYEQKAIGVWKRTD